MFIPSPTPSQSEPTHDAFADPGLDPNPEVRLCRPCDVTDRASVIHECDGPPCPCPICRDLRPFVAELEEDWNWRVRETGW